MRLRALMHALKFNVAPCSRYQTIYLKALTQKSIYTFQACRVETNIEENGAFFNFNNFLP